MMRLSVVLQTRLAVSALGLMLVAVTPLGAQEPQEGTEKLAIAESVIAREEAASERAFDPAFRTKAKEALAALPLAALEAQTGENGLGLNSLGDSQADLVYTPLTPCRIIDTRLAGGKIGAGAPMSFLVAGTNLSSQGGSATGCGVPVGPATAAVINFVAVDAAGRGNLQVTPYGTAMPLASIINFTAGFNIANGPSVALCDPSATTCTKDITIQANNSAAHLVADVQGYFRRVSTGGVGTALLADAAVTAPKIGSGVVVRSLNSQTDAVTLAGSNGLGVSAGSGTVTVSSNASATNTPSTIVARDASGNFSAGSIELAGNLFLPDTIPDSISPGVGILMKGGTPFLHNHGTENTFVGAGAGNFTLTGDGGNSALGYEALHSDTTGGGNSAFGYEALLNNTTGSLNSAFGVMALDANTAGNHNSAFGYIALFNNIEGEYNSAFASGALGNSTEGSANSAFGFSALGSSTSGSNNAAFGANSLGTSTAGYYNSAFGNAAFWQLASGDYNIAVGDRAGESLTSGSSNIYIGNYGVATESNTIRIGDTQTATYVAGISGQAYGSGLAVYVNSSGKLGTTTSSRRYKEQIVDMDGESNVLLKLRPVSFYYRPDLDETHLRQYGLVAEEVAEVAPDLVAYDKDGAPQAVRYHFVNAMLLNEVQKQRRVVEEQQTTIVRQESKIQDLEARLAKLEAALAGDR